MGSGSDVGAGGSRLGVAVGSDWVGATVGSIRDSVLVGVGRGGWVGSISARTGTDSGVYVGLAISTRAHTCGCGSTFGSDSPFKIDANAGDVPAVHAAAMITTQPSASNRVG